MEIRETLAVTMTLLENNRVLLRTEDEGINLPADFNIDRVSSLGMKLMRSLSTDLKRKLVIDGKNGTLISLVCTVAQIDSEHIVTYRLLINCRNSFDCKIF